MDRYNVDIIRKQSYKIKYVYIHITSCLSHKEPRSIKDDKFGILYNSAVFERPYCKT